MVMSICDIERRAGMDDVIDMVGVAPLFKSIKGGLDDGGLQIVKC